MNFLSGLYGKLLAFGAAIASAFVFVFLQRKDAANDKENEIKVDQLENTVKAVKEKKEIRDEIDSASDDDFIDGMRNG